MTEQTGLDDLNESDKYIEFAENPDPRAACMIVLDCSDSMAMMGPGMDPDPSNPETPMYKLNTALETLVTEVRKDPLTTSRLEISILPYGSKVGDPQPFKGVDDLFIPELEPMHLTSTGAALDKAMGMIEERKNEYKQGGVEYYRPFLILMTDGWATDTAKLKEVTPRLHEMEKRGSISFFPIAINSTAVDAMKGLSSAKPPLMLKDMNFAEFFVWLSASQAAVSASNPGDTGIAAPSIEGWATL